MICDPLNWSLFSKSVIRDIQDEPRAFYCGRKQSCMSYSYVSRHRCNLEREPSGLGHFEHFGGNLSIKKGDECIHRVLD